MDKKRRHWTPEEEQTVKEIVQNYMDKGKSKRKAFEEAARMIDRSPGTCSHRYYSKIHKKQVEFSLEMCIAFLKQGLNDDSTKENLQLLNEKERLLLEQKELKKNYTQLKMMQAKEVHHPL